MDSEKEHFILCIICFCADEPNWPDRPPEFLIGSVIISTSPRRNDSPGKAEKVQASGFTSREHCFPHIFCE